MELAIQFADFYKVSLDYLCGRTYEFFPGEKTDTVFVDDVTYKKLSETISSLSKPAKRELLKHVELLQLKEDNERKKQA